MDNTRFWTLQKMLKEKVSKTKNYFSFVQILNIVAFVNILSRISQQYFLQKNSNRY